jgi:hypothetical protein
VAALAHEDILFEADLNLCSLGEPRFASIAAANETVAFSLMSRGISESEASAMIVAGSIEPIVKELPLEYAIENEPPDPGPDGGLRRIAIDGRYVVCCHIG